MKTTAVRLNDRLHARLAFTAQLEGITATDLICKAVEEYVEARSRDPEFASKAQAVVEALDQEAAMRREAIASMFQPAGTDAEASDKAPARRGRRPSEAGD